MTYRVYRRRSRMTSIPSSNRYSSRALISSRSSTAKLPASSRLYSSQNPSRSHTSSFTRLRWRLKNTNTWPDNGSWRKTSCTCALSRSNDRRRSVAPRATKTRTDAGSVSMWSAGPGAPAAQSAHQVSLPDFCLEHNRGDGVDYQLEESDMYRREYEGPAKE